MSKDVTVGTASTEFQIVIGNPAVEQLTATIESANASANAGGLTYQSAKPEEREKMDAIIASIDLTNSDTIIALGEKERTSLADLADQMLNSMDPGVRVQFAEVLKELIDGVRNNNLDAIKKRVGANPAEAIIGRLTAIFTRRDYQVEATKKMITEFMTDVSNTRKVIVEMVGKLEVQKVELEKNFVRINELGYAITVAAADMRIVRAAVAEFIRRVEANEITVLTDLQNKAAASGRTDDRDAHMLAQANWNDIRTVDADLLGSISVYDMNIANLAFTKQANLQNRIQTRTTLTTTIAEWKTQLAIFAIVTAENAAAQLLNAAGDLTKQAVKQNADLFDTLVTSVSDRAARGTYNLKAIMEAQERMATTLETAGKKVEAEFARQREDKEKLGASIERFRKRTNEVYKVKPVAAAAAAPALGAPRPM